MTNVPGKGVENVAKIITQRECGPFVALYPGNNRLCQAAAQHHASTTTSSLSPLLVVRL